jgi:4-hydroxy-tetrahydrodipicolinate reductase
MADMKIAVMGVAGRMGCELVRALHATGGVQIAGGIERPGSNAIGQDIGTLAGIGPLGLPVTDDAL